MKMLEMSMEIIHLLFSSFIEDLSKFRISMIIFAYCSTYPSGAG